MGEFFQNPKKLEAREMLILTRKRSEQIIIGENIVVTIVSIRGDMVRLGIEAPEEISVHRQEIWQALKRQEAIRKEKMEKEGEEARG